MDLDELKARKKALRLTTNDIAWRADLPFGTVSKVFTGETKNPSYVTIEKILSVIEKEEMEVRIEAYRRAYDEYLKEHKGETVDPIEFEKEYRKKHHLSNEIIPLAKEDDENIIQGTLAYKTRNLKTINDLEQKGEDKRYELIDGHIILNEAPSVRHQRIVRDVGRIIDQFIRSNDGKCEVFDVGINTILDEDDYTLVIPDIAVLCDPSKLTDKGIWGPPDWVIEVVSESTRARDYKNKMHKYMGAGVREYWVIDFEKDKIVTFIEGEPMSIKIYGLKDTIPVYIYDSKLKIDFSEILKDGQ